MTELDAQASLVDEAAQATRRLYAAAALLERKPVTPHTKIIDGRAVHFGLMYDPRGGALRELDGADAAFDRVRALAITAGVDVAAFDEARAACARVELPPADDFVARSTIRLLGGLVCVAALRAAAPQLAWDRVTSAAHRPGVPSSALTPIAPMPPDHDLLARLGALSPMQVAVAVVALFFTIALVALAIAR